MSCCQSCDELEDRVKKLEDTSVMFKYDNPMQGKVSPEGSGQITDVPGVNDPFTRGETSSPEPSGVWIVYYPGVTDAVMRVYATELEALRYAVSSQVRACFLPFGTDVTDAINASSS